MPGVYVFRMASGLVQICGGSPISPDLLSETVSSGMTALTIILAMSLGLIVPRMLIERERRELSHIRSKNVLEA